MCVHTNTYIFNISLACQEQSRRKYLFLSHPGTSSTGRSAHEPILSLRLVRKPLELDFCDSRILLKVTYFQIFSAGISTLLKIHIQLKRQEPSQSSRRMGSDNTGGRLAIGMLWNSVSLPLRKLRNVLLSGVPPPDSFLLILFEQRLSRLTHGLFQRLLVGLQFSLFSFHNRTLAFRWIHGLPAKDGIFWTLLQLAVAMWPRYGSIWKYCTQLCLYRWGYASFFILLSRTWAWEGAILDHVTVRMTKPQIKGAWVPSHEVLLCQVWTISVQIIVWDSKYL